MRRTDLIFHAGGECLDQYGTFVRKTSPAEDNGYTHTRSGSVGPYVSGSGVLLSAAANVPRATWIDGAPYLSLGDARTNLVDSDDLTAWTDNGTPVITSSVDDPAGGTGAYTVEDNDGAAAEYKYRTIGFTGDGQKVVSFVVREDTMPASGVQRLQVFDSTAAASRLALDIASWSAGEPSVTASTGTHLGKRYIGNGYWQVFGLTTSVTAANTNRAEIRPAVTASETGSIDVYRVNAFNATVPDLAVLDASEARGAETLYADFLHAPQVMTGYLKFLTLTGSGGGSDARVFHIGSATGSSAPRLAVYDGASRYRLRHNNGVTAVTSADDNLTAASAFDIVELRCILNADGSVQLGQSIGGAAEEVSTASGASELKTAWADTRIYLNSAGSGNRGIHAYRAVKFARGLRTMTEMRAL